MLARGHEPATHHRGLRARARSSLLTPQATAAAAMDAIKTTIAQALDEQMYHETIVRSAAEGSRLVPSSGRPGDSEDLVGELGPALERTLSTL